MSFSRWLRTYFTPRQIDTLSGDGLPRLPTSDELRALFEGAARSSESVSLWDLIESGQVTFEDEPKEETPPPAPRLPKADNTSPDVRARLILGEDTFELLSKTLTSLGSPLTWEIRKTEHGLWAIWAPQFIGAPILLTQAEGIHGFHVAMSTLAMYKVAHLLLTGHFNRMASSAEFRLN